eukprot:134178-Rhodomonas_salina.1
MTDGEMAELIRVGRMLMHNLPEQQATGLMATLGAAHSPVAATLRAHIASGSPTTDAIEGE